MQQGIAEAFEFVGLIIRAGGGGCGGRRLYGLEARMTSRKLAANNKKSEPTYQDVVIKYLTERVSESEMAVYQGYLENHDSDAGLMWRKERNRRKRVRRKSRGL